MDELQEGQPKEQVVVSPELSDRMGEATRAIEAEQQDPTLSVATGTEQMSMMAELGKLAKDTTVHKLGILFKDVKAVFGILPNIGKISEWNTARIAKIPNAEKATTMTAEGVMGVSDKTVQEVAQAEVAARKAGAVYGVESAAYEQAGMYKAQSAMEDAGGSLAKARHNLEKTQKKFKVAPDMPTTNPKVLQAREQVAQAQTAFQQQTEAYGKVREAYLQTHETAIGRLKEVPMPGDPQNLGERISRNAKGEFNKRMGIHTDEAFRVKMEQTREKFKKAGKMISEEQLIRIVANGEAPSLSAGETAGRFVKHAGLHMLLAQIGPIIDPTPDVPGLVTLASFGAEVIGQQWWAGLVPPVWQYLHNRYEDVKLSYDSSMKARDIIRRHWNARVDRLEEKQIEKAAGVFLPKKELPLAV